MDESWYVPQASLLLDPATRPRYESELTPKFRILYDSNIAIGDFIQIPTAAAQMILGSSRSDVIFDVKLQKPGGQVTPGQDELVATFHTVRPR